MEIGKAIGSAALGGLTGGVGNLVSGAIGGLGSLMGIGRRKEKKAREAEEREHQRQLETTRNRGAGEGGSGAVLGFPWTQPNRQDSYRLVSLPLCHRAGSARCCGSRLSTPAGLDRTRDKRAGPASFDAGNALPDGLPLVCV